MRKHLNSHNDKGRSAMAGLLLTVLGCIPLAGCLFPQDEQVIGELPPKRNGPIQIKVTDPREPRTTFHNSTLCPGMNPTFLLTVQDEDVNDLVHSLWFIGGTNTQPFSPTPIQGGSSTARKVSAPSSLGFKSALANLATGTEILTVYVADTGFQEVIGGTIALVPRPARFLNDGTPLKPDEGSVDSFTWTLDVVPCQ